MDLRRRTSTVADGDGENAYGTFIAEQLQAEHDRRNSLDARAAALITISGAFSAGVLGIGSFALGKDFKPSEPVLWLFGIAVACLVGASVCGVLANASREYKVAGIKSLTTMVNTDRWFDSRADASRAIAGVHLATIETLRTTNGSKAKLLLGGVAAQLVAISLLGIALIVALLSGPDPAFGGGTSPAPVVALPSQAHRGVPHAHPHDKPPTVALVSPQSSVLS